MKSLLGSIARFLWKLLISMISVLITCVVLFGAIASIVLLYKVFPEIVTPMLGRFLIVLRIFSFLSRLIIWLLVITGIIYLGNILKDAIEERRDRRRIRKEEFLNDLAVKLSRKLKKKQA